MPQKKGELQYLERWRRRARSGEQLAFHNVAASYRILGRYRLSARWYERAAVKGDGDAMVDWGHCLQHGMGVRKDSAAAELAYRAAIKSNYISEYGREEAMYLLAVLLTQGRPRGWRREASTLLRRASADGDYPQAENLIEQLTAMSSVPICTCRRWLRPTLRRLACPIHAKPRRTKA